MKLWKFFKQKYYVFETLSTLYRQKHRRQTQLRAIYELKKAQDLKNYHEQSVKTVFVKKNKKQVIAQASYHTLRKNINFKHSKNNVIMRFHIIWIYFWKKLCPK